MGWVVLDGDDPGRVVARVPADDPLLEPKLIWEPVMILQRTFLD